MTMKIQLRPELENMIKQDVQRGSYKSIDEFVEHAISCCTRKKRGWRSMGVKSKRRSKRVLPRRDAGS